MITLTIEQLQKDREDLQQQLQQAIQAEQQATQQRTMIQGALQLLELQIARLNKTNELAPQNGNYTPTEPATGEGA